MSIQFYTRLLCKAAEAGNTEEVARLLPVSDPQADNSFALCIAAYFGHIACVQLLAPWSAPQTTGSMALACAVHGGHMECVEFLLGVSNPKAHGSMALQRAVTFARRECVELLYPVSDPQAALDQLKCDYPDHTKMWGNLEQRIACTQHQTLNDAIGLPSCSTRQRKI